MNEPEDKPVTASAPKRVNRALTPAERARMSKTLPEGTTFVQVRQSGDNLIETEVPIIGRKARRRAAARARKAAKK